MGRTDKNTRMLCLYHGLLTGKRVDKQAFCVEHNINERTFDRDIEDIRLFLSEEHPYCELKYDRFENMYFLSHVIGKSISSETTLYIVDILMSHKMIRKDELDEVLISLLGVTDSTRCNTIYDYIKKQAEIERSWSKRAILKMHWDLERAIENHYLIEIEYELVENELGFRRVKPVQLHAENGFIYLIAYIVDKQYKYPAYFRLDRINSFKIIHETYPPEIQSEYINQVNGIDRFSMLAGDEISVIVQVHERLKRVIKDVFPKSVLIKNDRGVAIYKIETLKQGFISWLLGQEGEALVLEPEELKLEVISIIKIMLCKYGKEER